LAFQLQQKEEEWDLKIADYNKEYEALKLQVSNKEAIHQLRQDFENKKIQFSDKMA